MLWLYNNKEYKEGLELSKKEHIVLFIISFIIWNLYFIFTTEWYHPFLQLPLSFFASYLTTDIYYHLENKKKQTEIIEENKRLLRAEYERGFLEGFKKAKERYYKEEDWDVKRPWVLYIIHYYNPFNSVYNNLTLFNKGVVRDKGL